MPPSATRRLRSHVILAMPVFLLPVPSFAVQYTLTDLGTLGGTSSRAYAINASGQIVGVSSNGSTSRAFLYSGGTMTDIGTLGGNWAYGYAINTTGQIAGRAGISNGDERAYIYSAGTMTSAGTLGGNYSQALGINASGQLVGNSSLSGDLNWHAFRYSGGTMTDLGALGNSYSYATGINDSGQVVGYSATKGGYQPDHAFLYTGGKMNDIGTLGGNYSYAYAINNSSQIVGDAFTAGDAADHAFLYSGSTMTDLGTLGGSSSVAYAINTSGQIVGDSKYTGGGTALHGFIYTSSVMTDLNSLIAPNYSFTIASARGINDTGSIVGYGTTSGGLTHAYLLTPSPTWTNTTNSGNAWSTGSNWDLAAAPASTLDATFNMNATYQVAFSAPAAASRLYVKGSDNVTLALASQTLTVTNGVAVSATGHLAFTGGNLQTANVTCAAPGGFTWSAGTLTLTDPAGLTLGATNLGANLTLAAAQNLTVNNTLTVPVSTTLDSRLAALTVGALTVSGAAQVGNLDGATGSTAAQLSAAGVTTVNTNATLTATRVRQQSITLHGDAANTSGKLTLTESSPTLGSGYPGGSNTFVSVTGTLNIDHSGTAYYAKLDVTNNDLIIDYTGASPYADIENMVRSGYNNGAWNGGGLISATAASLNYFTVLVLDNATANLPSFDGVTLDSTSIIVKFTHQDDLNGDGIVNAADKALFTANWVEGQTGATHRYGDMDFDGVYTYNDVALFNLYYNPTLPSLPEPASLAVLALGGIALLARQRR